MPAEPAFAAAVRALIYARWIEDAAPPSACDLAYTLGRPPAAVEDAFLTLADAHAIVLAPGTRSLWMAHPFSALPTPYRVSCGGRSYWANCAWDAFGIAAMLGRDAECRTQCPDCGDPLDLSVRGGSVAGDAVVHFAVPPRDFWKDIGHT